MMTDCDADRDEFDGTVELHQAFLWTCEACGIDSFERAIEVDPLAIDTSLPQPQPVLDFLDDLAAGGAGALLIGPTVVRCGHCGAMYAATDRREDEDTGEDDDDGA